MLTPAICVTLFAGRYWTGSHNTWRRGRFMDCDKSQQFRITPGKAFVLSYACPGRWATLKTVLMLKQVEQIR